MYDSLLRLRSVYFVVLEFAVHFLISQAIKYLFSTTSSLYHPPKAKLFSFVDIEKLYLAAISQTSFRMGFSQSLEQVCSIYLCYSVAYRLSNRQGSRSSGRSGRKELLG